MDLCLCFGEPSRSRLMQRMSATELNEWRQYSRQRPLPTHTPTHILQFLSLWVSMHSKKKSTPTSPDDFLVYREKPKAVIKSPEESRKHAEGMQVALQLIAKAKNGNR